MNKEIKTFNKKYKVGERFPTSWYGKFIGSHLYSKYYTFVAKTLTRHGSTFKRELNQGLRKYKQLDRKWETTEKKPVFKAA